MHLYLGMMTSTRCPLFWMERPSPATTSPKPPTLATGAISLAMCTTWYLGLKWRIISNSMRIRISQYTVLLILTTIYSSCAPAADISAQSQNARAQLEREYNEFIFEFLPLRCHWCFERVKQVSNKILHLFLRDGTVRCWGKESSCGPQSIAPHHQLQLYQQPTTNSCEV